MIASFYNLIHNSYFDQFGTVMLGDALSCSARKDSLDSNYTADQPIELVRTKSLDSLHLKFNSETGALLPLALRYGSHYLLRVRCHSSNAYAPIYQFFV